jgi:hypothetical protein
MINKMNADTYKPVAPQLPEIPAASAGEQAPHPSTPPPEGTPVRKGRFGLIA